jgi:Ca2+-binding RTX toxin-like protein
MATIVGDGGNNTLTGASGDDSISGPDGNDTLTPAITYSGLQHANALCLTAPEKRGVR